MINYPKGKLVYIYLEGFANFKPFSINFSNEFEFEIKGDIIKIKRYKDHFKDILGENILSLNIIAGENGVGKSTLLKVIAELIADRDTYEPRYGFNFFLVFQLDNETFYIKSPDGHSGPFPFGIREHQLYSFQFGQTSKDFGRTIIYYSPYLDFNRLDIYGSRDGYPILDLSNTQILIDDLEENPKDEPKDVELEEDPIVRHRVNNVRRQLKLFNETGSFFNFPFELPKRLSVTFHRLNFDRSDVSILDRNFFDDMQDRCSAFFREFPENKLSKSNMAKIMFLRNLLSMFFISVNLNKSQSILQHRFSDEIIKRAEELSRKDPEDLVDFILYFFQKQDIFQTEIFQKLIEYTFSAIKSNNIRFSNSNHNVTVLIDNEDQVIGGYFALLEAKVSMRSQDRYITPNLSHFISFDWHNFSSGEKMFTDLFSRIYGVKEKFDKIKQPILLLIDEGEMGFHPKWQIKFISTLRTFINEFFYGQDLEIILATHSPLVLSDFPSRRVHLFKKPKRGKSVKMPSIGTLAQNTSELLAHEFFIDTTLVGDVAREYINGIITDIRAIKTERVSTIQTTDIARRIELIDEPIIKNILRDELERTFNA